MQILLVHRDYLKPILNHMLGIEEYCNWINMLNNEKKIEMIKTNLCQQHCHNHYVVECFVIFVTSKQKTVRFI